MLGLIDFLEETRDGMSTLSRPQPIPPRIFNRDLVVQSALTKFPSRWEGHANAEITILVRSIVDAVGQEIDRLVSEEVL